jgi:hypothetical protein
MREVIIREWRDDLGIIHRSEVSELVRCGDCIYTYGERPRVVGLVYCKEHKMVKSENDYCSYGERLK